MARINRPYVGIPTFLRSKAVEDLADLDAMVAILGVPFDEGSPFLPGSRMGPRALREQSLRFAGRPGFYDFATEKEYLREETERGLIADVGDVDIYPTNPERTFQGQTEMGARNSRAGGHAGHSRRRPFDHLRHDLRLRRADPHPAVRRPYRLRTDYRRSQLH